SLQCGAERHFLITSQWRSNSSDPSWMKLKHLEMKTFPQDAVQFIRRDQEQSPAVCL
ncbi:hypothetical protein QQF64_036412, partial [Cirrhinus molitorella]